MLASVRYSFLDGIRAIAILMVVLVHVSQRVTIGQIEHGVASMGQYGVQLFFVISSITVYVTLGRFNDSWLERSLWIGARFAKIFPLYLYGILLYTLYKVFVIYAGLGGQGIYLVFSDVVLNVFLIHGFFPSANNSVVPGGWSIGVEVIAYLVAFVLLRRLSTGKMLLLFGLIVFFVNIFFVWWGGYYVENNKFAYYSPLNQLPVFIISWLLIRVGYIRFGVENNSRSGYKINFFVIVLFCALTFFSLKFVNYRYVLIPIVVGVFFIIQIHVVSNCEYLKMVFSMRGLCFIGRVSYSIYVNHFIVLWACVYLFRKIGVDLVGLGWLLALYIIVFIGTLLVSVITYKYIECYFCELYKRFTQPAKIDVF